MLSFESDYNKGAHNKILERLLETNMEARVGYGCDTYCDRAKAKIKEYCNCPGADIYFLAGGTQTNQIVIDSMLKGFEGVVAAVTGHVSAHEAGAVEYTGHKVLTVPQTEGKMQAEDLRTLLRTFYEDNNHDHMVFPGMVYISHPTEYGTLYTKKELEALYGICNEYNIPLFIDGARLGYGLMSRGTDVTLPDIAKLCDVFYIGGTKVGALFGEAVVFTRGNMPKHFTTTVKQHGALLAKGSLMGIQFDALFTDDLYFEISKNAIDRAEELKAVLREKKYQFYIDSPTNQIFVLLPDERLKELRKNVSVGFWEKTDEHHTVVRFATSWATTCGEIHELAQIL